MKEKINFIEKVIVIILLVIYSGGILTLVVSGGESQGLEKIPIPPDYPQVQQTFIGTYIIIAALLAPHWKKALVFVIREKFLFLLLLLIAISFFWSASPDSTMRRGVALVFTSLFGLYLSVRYTIQKQIELLLWTFGVIVVLSLLFIIFIPHYGIMAGTHSGTWRGIYNHKNVLAKFMVPSTYLFLLFAIDNKKYSLLLRSIFILGVVVSMLLLLMSSSKSGLVTLLVVLAILPACHFLRYRIDQLLIFFSLIVFFGSIIISWTFTNAEKILLGMGKDLTLTGRMPLWNAVLELVDKKPWVGYGYSALWTDWNDETATVWRTVGWVPPNAHSGFLELLLGLGVVGLIIFALGFFAALFKIIFRIRYSKSATEFWFIGFMLFITTSSLTESALVYQNSLTWVIYSSILVTMRNSQIESSNSS